MDFKELIKDKTCVVVAPSGFMSGRGHGKWIDSFDFVVKTNKMYLEISNSYDFGERLDLWYGRPITKDYVLDYDFYGSRNIKMMCLLPQTRDGWEQWEELHQKFIIKNKKYNFPYRVTDKSEFIHFEEKLDSVPTTGVFAIYDLLNQGAGKVFALGFDFHRSGYGHSQAVDLTTINGDRHKTKPQMKYLWELLKSETRFECDLNLKHILHEEFDPNYCSKRWLSNVLRYELDTFCRNLFDEKTLVFRSCTLSNFSIIAEILNQKWCNRRLSYLAQSSIIKYLDFDGPHVIDYGSDDPFNYDRSMQITELIEHKYTTCIIPYNGLELINYYEIFKIVRDLNIRNVFLVSQRGNLKRLVNIGIICSELETYGAKKQEYQILRDKYECKNIF